MGSKNREKLELDTLNEVLPLPYKWLDLRAAQMTT